MSRTLETVLTGRNLLSPVLVDAARDVTTFNSTVTAANEKAATSATASARAQQAATTQVIASNSKSTEAVVAGSARQVAARRGAIDAATALAAAEQSSSAAVVSANSRTSAAVSGTSATYKRSAASLREKLGLQALDVDATARSAAVNSRAAQSAGVFSAALDRETAAVTVGTRALAENTAARQGNSLAARSQETAARSLASSNGLLGTSLTPLTAGLGAVALGMGYGISKAMDFDSAMSQVHAATQGTAADMSQLRDAAVEAGAKTQYSASEAAQGISELSKAGVSTTDILGGGLAGALNLAAAGQMEVADAAELSATALTVFGLKGDQVNHVADLLAAGAGKAQGSVGDLGQALNQSALVAQQTGLSVEDTAGALAMFASNGLIGSDAGTSFKTMLQALTPNSLAASKAMDAIGFSAYDAQGNFVGMASVAEQLKSGLSKLTVEQQNATLKTIFGSDAVRAASILYKEGAAGVNDWTGKVNDAGFAAKVAGQLMDTLGGDLSNLGSAAETFFIQLGEGAQGPLRLAVEGLTALVNVGGDVLGFWNALPGPVQAGVAAFVAFTLLRGPLDSLFTRVAVGITSTVTGMGMATGATGLFGAAAATARVALMGLLTTAAPFLALAGIAAAVTRLIEVSNSASDARDKINDLTAAYDDAPDGEKFGQLASALSAVQGEADKARARLDELKGKSGWDKFWSFDYSGDVEMATNALDAAQTKVDELTAAQDRARSTVGALAAQYHIAKDDVVAFANAHGIDLTGGVDAASWAFQRLASSTGDFAPQMAAVKAGLDVGFTSLEAYAAGLGLDEAATKDLITKTSELGQSLADFVTPLNTYTGMLQDKAQAEADAANATAEKTGAQTKSWQDYVANVHVSFDDYMKQLEEQVTAQTNWQTNMLLLAGRVSQGTLDELAKMGPEGAPLVADLVTRSDAELSKFSDITAARSKEATDAWGAQLTMAAPILAAVGKTAGQGVVAELVGQLQAGTTTVAQIAAQYGINLAGGINPVLSALGKAKITYSGSAVLSNGRLAGYASGGYTGDGGKHEPAGIVHRGEFVMPQEAVSRIGVGTLGAMAGLPGYANGGYVTSADVPRPSSTAPYGPPISSGGDSTMQVEYESITKWMDANLSSVAGPGGSVERWRPVVLRALSMLGEPGALANGVLRLIQAESGGNPNAINLWDSNARAGHPSQGLMQTIPATFAAYRSPALPNSLVDPLANIYAGINYALHRYGPQMLAAGGRKNAAGGYMGYETGTAYVPETGLALLHKGEAVVPASRNPAAMPGYDAGRPVGATAIDYDKLAAAIGRAMPRPTTVAVDARGFNADQIAAAAVSRIRREEFLAGV